MRIYFGLGSVPELSGLRPDQRRRIWQRNRPLSGAAFWVGLALLVGLGCGIGAGLIGLPGALLGLALSSFLGYQALVRRALPAIRRDIARRSSSSVGGKP